jgi:hypothetical protein
MASFLSNVNPFRIALDRTPLRTASTPRHRLCVRVNSNRMLYHCHQRAPSNAVEPSSSFLLFQWVIVEVDACRRALRAYPHTNLMRKPPVDALLSAKLWAAIVPLFAARYEQRAIASTTTIGERRIHGVIRDGIHIRVRTHAARQTRDGIRGAAKTPC